MLLPNVTEETEPRKPGEEFDAELCFARRLRKQLVPPPPNTHTPRSGAGAFGELLSSSVAVLTHPQHPPSPGEPSAGISPFIHSLFLSFTNYVWNPCSEGGGVRNKDDPPARGLVAGGLQVKPRHPKPGLAPPPRPSWGTMVAPPKRAPSRRANEELHRAGGNGTGA